MGKRLEINPGWLVGLLNQWAIHDLRTQTKGLGFASGSGWMRGLKSSPASSIDPTGFAAKDFRDIDEAMDTLREEKQELWIAVNMYYKPWGIQAARDEGWPFANSTYYSRLHRGHAELAILLAYSEPSIVVLAEAPDVEYKRA